MATPYLRKGRQIDFGFEPCANAFFDFYVTPKYIDPPLLELEDIAFFLFLRKNVNVHNSGWRMPSIRQMMRRLGVSQRKLEAMMARLIKAGLLEKVSGYRAGEKEGNIPNDYLLSDPLPNLEEFLAFAVQGGFGQELNEQWREYIAPTVDAYPVREVHTAPVREMHTGVRENDTAPVGSTRTHKQTSLFKQNDEISNLWESVVDTLRLQLARPTFESFLAPAQLTDLCDGVATITIPDPKAKDWIENRLARQLKQLLSIEGKTKVETIRVLVES